MSPTTASISLELQLGHNDTLTMLQAEIAAATGTARSAWWDAHSDATQATVKNLRLHWKFSAKYPRFPNGDSYDHISMLPRTYQQWDETETQKCITALLKGDLVAVAWEPDLTTEHHSEASSSASKTASSTNSWSGAENSGHKYRARSDTTTSLDTTESPASISNKELITSKHYQRIMERLRALLKHATGYSFPAKQNTHLLFDNRSGEGAYRWCFTEYFRGFPPNPPSKWTTPQCRAVEEALDRNWVSVTPLPGTEKSDSPPPDHISTRSLRSTTIDQRPPPSQPPRPISTAYNPSDGQLPTHPTEPMPALLAALNRDLTTAYDRTITSLTTTLHASASTHHTFLSSSLARLATELASQRSNDHSEISNLKQKIAAQSRGATEAELEQARAEGDAAGQQRVIQNMGDVRNGLFRSHLEELMRVRREARMEGYEAGFQAGVEQGRGRAEKGEREVRLGSLFSEVESETKPSRSEGYNPESEFGLQGHLGIIGGRRPAAPGEQAVRDAEIEVGHQEAEVYNPESEFQLQPHLGITGGRCPESSGLKRPRDDDGDLYDASPLRATKRPNTEHPNNRGAEDEVQTPTEKRLSPHKKSSGGLANSFSGGLFLSSDEEIDDGGRKVSRKDREGDFSYFH